MVGRVVVIIMMLAFVLLAGGCSQEAVYDLEKFEQINAYVNEIIQAIDETVFDFEVWVTNLACDERREWLQMDADRITDINRRYFTADFPAYEEINTWYIPVSDGKEDWNIRGSRLASALQKMEEASKELVSLIDSINSIDDEDILAGKREAMEPVLEKALRAAGDLRDLFRLE